MSKTVYKKWGQEIWLHNEPDYCFKILVFNPNSKFSLHFHIKKRETWYCVEGSFALTRIDPKIAKRTIQSFSKGDHITIEPGTPHQLIAGPNGGTIAEASTQHFDSDSYRIEPGDSQCSYPQENTTTTTDG